MRVVLITVLVVLGVILIGPAQAGIRVTAEQPVVNPVLAPQDGNQRTYAIATDGDQFLTLWANDGNGANGLGLNVALIAADGRRLSSRFVPGTPNAVYGVIGVCWTGSAYVVWWNEESGISTVTFSRSGDLIQPPTVVMPGKWATPGTLAWNGSRALLLYLDEVTMALKGALFNADGSLIKAELPIPAVGVGYGVYLQAASDGRNFAAISQTNGVLRLIRITENGDVDGSPIQMGLNFGDFKVTFGRGLYAIVSQEVGHLIRFIVDPHTESVMRLPPVDEKGSAPAVFWNGSRFVAYWTQGKLLKTVPFSGDAEEKAPEPATAFTFEGNAYPVVMASNGRNAFSAWTPGQLPQSPVYGARFNANATAIMELPQVISIAWSRQYSPSIATSGSDSLLVWNEQSVDVHNGRLVAARLSANGAVLDVTPLEIAPIVARWGTTPVPAVVFTGTVYLVAWVDGAYEAPKVVKMRRIARDGSLSAPVSLEGTSYVSAATNGTTTLVVCGSQFGANRISGYRYDAIGNSIDKTPIVISTEGSVPRVASNGTDFFVAWAEGTDFSTESPVYYPPNLFDVFGARVFASGAVDVGSLAIAVGPSDQILTGLASDGRDYVVSYVASGDAQSFLSAKRIHEGNLDGATATDDGTIMARGAYGGVHGGMLSGDSSGYWAALMSNGVATIVRTDLRGVPTSRGPSFATESWLAPAQVPGGPIWLAYTRRSDDGAFAFTSQAFLRSATVEPDVPRSRAARH